MHVCVCACMRACMYVCVHACVCACVCVCVHVCSFSLKVSPFVGTLQCVPLNTAVPVQVHTPGETQVAVSGVQDSGTPTVHVPLPTVASANRHLPIYDEWIHPSLSFE